MAKKSKSDLVDDLIDDSVKFSKSQILRSDKFMAYSDIISVCLQDDELISVHDLSARIDSFLKGKV